MQSSALHTHTHPVYSVCVCVCVFSMIMVSRHRTRVFCTCAYKFDYITCVWRFIRHICYKFRHIFVVLFSRISKPQFSLSDCSALVRLSVCLRREQTRWRWIRCLVLNRTVTMASAQHTKTAAEHFSHDCNVHANGLFGLTPSCCSWFCFKCGLCSRAGSLSEMSRSLGNSIWEPFSIGWPIVHRKQPLNGAVVRKVDSTADDDHQLHEYFIVSALEMLKGCCEQIGLSRAFITRLF